MGRAALLGNWAPARSALVSAIDASKQGPGWLPALYTPLTLNGLCMCDVYLFARCILACDCERAG